MANESIAQSPTSSKPPNKADVVADAARQCYTLQERARDIGRECLKMEYELQEYDLTDPNNPFAREYLGLSRRFRIALGEAHAARYALQLLLGW